MGRINLFKDFLQCDVAKEQYFTSFLCLAEYILRNEAHVLGLYFTSTKQKDVPAINAFLWNSINAYDALAFQNNNIYNRACYIDWLTSRSERFLKSGMSE